MVTIPPATIKAIHALQHFIVERARTARRFIKTTNPPFEISSLEIIEFDKSGSGMAEALNWLSKGISVGVISESGMPGIADPGSDLVFKAQMAGIRVIPLVGPSSILLALTASGLNGQSFAFQGYLPIKEGALKAKLRSIEQLIIRENQTQIFIETPYRNDRLFSLLIKSLDAKIILCIARDITGENQFILSKSIKEWNKDTSFKIEKHPTIFLLGKGA